MMKADRCTGLRRPINSSEPVRPEPAEKEGGWSIKEILGHLFDSAGNNHQRLLRYVKGGELKFPGYDQEEFVRRANYQEFRIPGFAVPLAPAEQPVVATSMIISPKRIGNPPSGWAIGKP